MTILIYAQREKAQWELTMGLMVDRYYHQSRIENQPKVISYTLLPNGRNGMKSILYASGDRNTRSDSEPNSNND